MAWVCIFTCITIKAIHLELIEGMTSEQFLLALRRFVACRGKPNEIISDNATHFKVTRNTVDVRSYGKHYQKPFSTYNERIKWSFIIELSPWIGEFYKHLARIKKKVPLKNYWKTILNKFAVPNSYIRDWSNCKYNTICLCRQQIETKEDHQTNTFLIYESKNWFSINCEQSWRWRRQQHQQP